METYLGQERQTFPFTIGQQVDYLQETIPSRLVFTVTDP